MKEDYKPCIEVAVKMEDQLLYITIADNGEGMTDEVKERLYENIFCDFSYGRSVLFCQMCDFRNINGVYFRLVVNWW